MKITMLFFLGCAMTLSYGRAQPRTGGVPQVELTFTVFATERVRNIRYVPAPNEVPVELRFFSSQRSQDYDYQGPSRLIFFFEATPPAENGRNSLTATGPDRVTVGEVAIPQGMSRVLIVFTPEGVWSPNTIPRYVVRAFDDSERALPKGHAAFLNATDAVLLGRLGDRSLELPVGMSPAIPLGPDETSVVLGFVRDGLYVPTYGDVLTLDPGQRATIVLLPPRSPDQPLLQRRILYDGSPSRARRPRPDRESAAARNT